MKNFILLVALLLTGHATIIAQEDYTPVERFDKLIIGQKIVAVLEQGTTNQVHFKFHDIDKDELVIRQSGMTLEIFLQNARNWEKHKNGKWEDGWSYNNEWYRDGWVEVHVTFRDLSELTLKGAEDIIIKELTTDRLKLKGYGAMDIQVDNLVAEKLKVKLYGENELNFKGGAIGSQKYKLFGENTIDADKVLGERVKASNFGETELIVSAETVKFTVFGEMDITCSRQTNLRKGIVLGEYSVDRW